MRWLSFAVIALICVTVHTTLGARLAVGGVRPDWILVAVVFFAMHGPGTDAVVAGWMLGMLADFQSVERFGLLSLTYGLTAGAVYLTREVLFRAHPLAHFAITLAAGLFVQAVLWLYYVIGGDIGSGLGTREAAMALGIALYSALWAPVFQAGLIKLGPWLGLDRKRYSHAGLSRAVR